MRFRGVVFVLDQLLYAVRGEDEQTADMFLPESLLSMAFGFVAGAGLALCAAALRDHVPALYLAAGMSLVMGVLAFLRWRNRKICMLNEEEFAYTTMWGKTTIYRFEDIVALSKKHDTQTLILKTGKVRIEPMAIVSDRLSRRIADEFERIPAK